MSKEILQTFITMCVYIAIVICIGVYFAKRSNKNSENFFIGGRSLGPWVAAMSAEASDMSGWLLMGLPGVAYWCGIADAFWTAVGLAVGTYLNWLIVSKRLRKYSVVAGNAITIPDFFSNRFKENKKVLMTIASLFIVIFFSVYAGSCFVTCGKLFNQIFGIDYQLMMVIGAIFVIAYTFLGGFLAESVSDFMQALLMIISLLVMLLVGVFEAGGISHVIENINGIPGFTEFFNIAQPTVVDGVQQVADGEPVFGPAVKYGFLSILSMMAWGLGYFGMPQVLLRFIAIRKADELKRSRRIATVWCVISLAAAVCIGLIGRSVYSTAPELLTKSGAETIFIYMSKILLHPIFAGVIMAGILAATISSSDSYLLIAVSAISKNLYQGVLKKNATDKQVMTVSRITMLIVALIGIIIALDENSIIFGIVSFAWAGFGATFGPLMLFSLFWKRINRAGAIAGMLSGGIAVFVWKLVLNPLGGIFSIYELLPAFIISCIFIVVVSLCTKAPSAEIQAEFEAAKTIEC
ncbi:MAG: sodium/proline symporter PutP [Ruminococcaceae bacterium]|nr:sodium/proline symporter PutP [Oscillospiraceae bacterium]